MNPWPLWAVLHDLITDLSSGQWIENKSSDDLLFCRKHILTWPLTFRQILCGLYGWLNTKSWLFLWFQYTNHVQFLKSKWHESLIKETASDGKWAAVRVWLHVWSVHFKSGCASELSMKFVSSLYDVTDGKSLWLQLVASKQSIFRNACYEARWTFCCCHFVKV